MSRTRRTLRITAAALALTALVATAGAAPARAAAPVAHADLFCTLFPWLCPPPGGDTGGGTGGSTPAPTTTTTPPAPAPGGTPSPKPSTTTPKAGTSPSRSAPPSPSPSPSGTGTTPPAVAQACDTSGLPTGRIAIGSTQARDVAAAMKACTQAQDAAAAAGDPVAPAAAAKAPGLVVTTTPTDLEAASQTVNGFSYDGVTTLTTADGPLRVLKFRADSVVIENLRQSVASSAGVLRVAPGRTVRLTGNVELYVLTQTGDVFGLLPLTISPDSPPPLTLPFLVFTNVTSQIAYFRADRVTLGPSDLSVS